MKSLIIPLLFIHLSNIFAQDQPAPFNAEKWQAPYHLDIPKGWVVERFPIPIEFAPKIPYQGVEDLRFTPGWGDPKSEEYWTYAFLWFLEGQQKLNETSLEQNMKEYYSGLVGRNIGPRKIPQEKLIPTTTEFIKADTAPGDLETFTGEIHMLDYLQQKPMVLNSIVHIRTCLGKSNTFVFFEISPQPATHGIWKNLDQIWKGFNCKVE